MTEYWFTIEVDGASDESGGRLYEICDDATFGRQGEKWFADFTRESASLESALRSAMKDIEKAGLKAVRYVIEANELPTLSQHLETWVGQSKNAKIVTIVKDHYPRAVTKTGYINMTLPPRSRGPVIHPSVFSRLFA